MKIKSARHGSKSSSKGRIVSKCPCGGDFIVVMSDHYNLVAECSMGCGNMRDEHRMHGGITVFDMNKGRR